MYVGSYEILLDDAVLMGNKIPHCNVRVIDGQIHDFNLLVDWLPEAKEEIDIIGDFILSHKS